MQQPHIYRVDRFVVPDAARDEFLGRVQETHALLRRQPGFVRDLLLEAPGAGWFQLVTLAEWQDGAAVEGAKAAVQAIHAKTGFDRRATLARLGIQAEIGTYQQLAVPS